MQRGEANVGRLRGRLWGDSLISKLPSHSRQRRKRLASKVRRADLKRRLRDELD